MKKFLFPLFLFVLGVSTLISVENVGAVSDYDDVIKVQEFPISLKDRNGSGFAPITFNDSFDIGYYIGGDGYSARSACNGYSSVISETNYQAALDGISEGKPYVITSSPNDEIGTIVVAVWVGELDTFTTSWDVSGVYQGNGIDTDWITFNISYTTYAGKGMIICSGTPWSTDTMQYYASISADFPPFSVIEIGNFSLDYPEDYEGLPAPEPPNPQIDYQVEFSFINTPTSITAKYISYSTDPESDLPPPNSVTWAIYDSTDFTILDQVCEATRLKDVDFSSQQMCPDFVPDLSIDYYIRLVVNPLSPANQELFPEYEDINFLYAYYKFRFDTSSSGTTVSCEGGALPPNSSIICNEPQQFNIIDCLDPDFPYIDLEGCVETFTILFTYFNLINPTLPGFSYIPNCHNYNTLDDWLGLPDSYQVCPQIPEFVRDVVTPFVAFMLGLVTIGFFNKIRGDFDG